MIFQRNWLKFQKKMIFQRNWLKCQKTWFQSTFFAISNNLFEISIKKLIEISKKKWLKFQKIWLKFQTKWLKFLKKVDWNFK